MEPPAEKKENRYSAESAQHAFEQTRMLWDDQASYAEVLREKRRTYSTGLVLVAGLGLFRLSWYRSAGDVPLMEPGPAIVLKLLLFFALLGFLGSAYFLYTERPVASAVLGRLWPWGGRRLLTIRAALGLVDPDGEQSGARAIAALELDNRRVRQIARAPLWQVWIYREARLRLAYERLLASNRRVNGRIRLGVIFMGFGYAVVMVVFLVYLVST